MGVRDACIKCEPYSGQLARTSRRISFPAGHSIQSLGSVPLVVSSPRQGRIYHMRLSRLQARATFQKRHPKRRNFPRKLLCKRGGSSGIPLIGTRSLSRTHLFARAARKVTAERSFSQYIKVLRKDWRAIEEFSQPLHSLVHISKFGGGLDVWSSKL